MVASILFAVSVVIPGVGKVALECTSPGPWKFGMSATAVADGISTVKVDLHSEREAPPPRFSVKWFISQKDVHRVWSADSTHDGIPWGSPFRAELTSWMPLYAFLDANDRNRLTVACSESCRKTEFRAPIGEKRMGFGCSFRFFTVPEAPMKEYGDCL